jgi:hypothetical protein
VFARVKKAALRGVDRRQSFAPRQMRRHRQAERRSLVAEMMAEHIKEIRKLADLELGAVQDKVAFPPPQFRAPDLDRHQDLGLHDSRGGDQGREGFENVPAA